MNDLSTHTTNNGPATVVILADNASAGELAQRCQAAGMTARPVEQAYAAACELLAVDRAVLVIDFDNPQFLQSGLLALAARRSVPVLRIKAAEPLVAELARLLKVEPPAEETVEEPPADAAPAPAEPAGVVDKSSFGPGVSEIVSDKKAEAANANALAMQADDTRDDCSQHGAEKTFVNRSKTPVKPQIDTPPSAPVDQEPDLGDLLTEEEIAALLRRHP